MRFDLKFLYLSNDVNFIYIGENLFGPFFGDFNQYCCIYNEFIGMIGRFRFCPETFVSPGSFFGDIFTSGVLRTFPIRLTL